MKIGQYINVRCFVLSYISLRESVLVGLSPVLLLLLVLAVSSISFEKSTFLASWHTKNHGHNEAQSGSILKLILVTVPAFTVS